MKLALGFGLALVVIVLVVWLRQSAIGMLALIPVAWLAIDAWLRPLYRDRYGRAPRSFRISGLALVAVAVAIAAGTGALVNASPDQKLIGAAGLLAGIGLGVSGVVLIGYQQVAMLTKLVRDGHLL